MPDTRKISYGSPYKQPSLDDMRRYVAEREQRAREAAWLAANPRADINPVEQPFLDPVDTVTGGVMALPRGIGNALADMAIDTGIGFAMDYGMGDATPAMFIGKKGMQKLGMNAERDLFGQFSGLWDKGVRAEIDPAQMSTRGIADIEPQRAIDIDQVIGHDDLYRAYPGARDVRYMYDEAGERVAPGDAAFGDNVVVAGRGDAETLRGNVGHELQHAIQEREGFARGGNPATSPSTTELGEAINAKFRQRVEDIRNTPGYQAYYQKQLEELPERVSPRTGRKTKDKFQAQEAADWKFGVHNIEIEREKNIEELFKDSSFLQPGYAGYRRLAGEWEARNAGTRAVLPSDDPRLGNALATPSATFRTGNPFSTADDIPLDDLIVRMDGGEARSYNAGMDLIDEIKPLGADVDADGMVTVYHRTNKDSAKRIRETGQITPKEDGIFFSTKPDGQNVGYGEEIIEFKIPAGELMLDDIFGDEAHLRLPAKRNKPNNIRKYIR